ncbi:MAG TPA: glycosyl hydrolase 115 family protein [Opitutaceae bacterium]|nr:glycosyl hydrolase 115 family protein [Opitutaceae bacterium]
MKTALSVWAALLLIPAAAAMDVPPAAGPGSVKLAGGGKAAAIAVDPKDYPVVGLAANLLAGDIQRVSGERPEVTYEARQPQMIIVGTLGHSALVDRLAQTGRLPGVDAIRGQWEHTWSAVVDRPFPGVDRALVIAGSDRRGAAYGLMELSEKIGVSPWNWWADVPARHRDELAVDGAKPEVAAPAVKYRGIFINDEDWGLNPWASKTFDPAFGNIGPKTYEKVFELLLRLKLNYLWPAMHGCSTAFGAVPENYALADKYAIVAGSSHCEPMLYNNVHWDEKVRGKWNYSTNRDAIHGIWQETAQARGGDEAVWTLGIRGIHDAAMETPPSDIPGKLGILTDVIRDQRSLIGRYVTRQWGPPAQCFIPYKEVLPIYDSGLKVPGDVTLVWVDDNFGYVRRYGAPAERRRPGGAGIYWHISYYGGPHSYTWINTTAPALMWEELHKAWDNDARTLWVLNVGDIKPMEIGIDYFSRLAWNPAAFPTAQEPEFLHAFAARNFSEASAKPLEALLREYYRLGTIHKPELMDRAWAMSLPPEQAAELAQGYAGLLKFERLVAARIPADQHDAYTELVGFPARVLGTTGLIFMVDRQMQLGRDAAQNEKIIQVLRADLGARVADYNTQLAGGKWNLMMPGPDAAGKQGVWSTQVRWPWNEKAPPAGTPPPPSRPAWPDAGQTWRLASRADHTSAAGSAQWVEIDGLGTSDHAMALEPAGLTSSWKPGDTRAPRLEYSFKTAAAGSAAAYIDFLPTFRICPGMKLRVAVIVDHRAPIEVEVPGSSGAENEQGTVRQFAVQDNYVRARVPLADLPAGEHTFTIRAVDPGAVVDRVALP